MAATLLKAAIEGVKAIRKWIDFLISSDLSSLRTPEKGKIDVKKVIVLSISND